MGRQGPARLSSARLDRLLVPAIALPVLLVASFLAAGRGEEEGATGPTIPPRGTPKGDAGDPFEGRKVLTLEPGDGRTASLPRGPVSLLQFLQNLAAAGGKTVCWEDADPGARVSLPRAIDVLDVAAATKILEADGYRLRRQTIRGKEVYWVDRTTPAPRKKGRIVREGEKVEEETPAAPEAAAPGRARELRTAGGAAGASGKVRLYAEDGAAGPRYLVIFETDSRQEAEEAANILKAYERSRAAPTAPSKTQR